MTGAVKMAGFLSMAFIVMATPPETEVGRPREEDEGTDLLSLKRTDGGKVGGSWVGGWGLWGWREVEGGGERGDLERN